MEPIADTEIKRVLVVNAHPDDSDFGASGTISQWVKKGIEVAYVFCTNGDQGGKLLQMELPLIQERHHGYHDADPEYRDVQSKKNYDRILEKYRGKEAILSPRR